MRAGWRGGTTGRARPDRLPGWARVGLAVALVLVGTVLALRPFRSLAVLVVLLVVALALSGVGDLVTGRRPWGPLRGIVRLLAALVLLLWPGPGIGVLTLVVAVMLAVDGVLGIVEGARSSGPDRWAAGLTGLALVLVGVLALTWRDVALLVVAVALGVRLALLGLRLLRRPSSWSRSARPARPDGVTRAALAAGGAVVLAVVGVVVQLGHPRPDAFYDIPERVPTEPGRLLRAEPFTTRVPEGASAWRILYTTTRDDGEPAAASGLVVTPDQVTGPTPVVAWAHGTTGWAPGCAPSLLDEPFEAGALLVLDEVMEQGWTLVATDDVGLGTESPHPYVIGQGEGRSVLDSLRAARELETWVPGGPALDGRTVVWGALAGRARGAVDGHARPRLRPRAAPRGRGRARAGQ